MPKTAAIIGCLDTKGNELAYLKACLEKRGLATHVLDTGILGEPAFAADTPREAIAQAAGCSLAELQAGKDRGQAIFAMCRGAELRVGELLRTGGVHGIIAAGGSANTTIAAAAMRILPVGFPKLIVSTLASGDTSPYVGIKDVTLMYSVVDIAGLNRLSRTILANAAHALAGMILHEVETSRSDRPLLAATMFGVTTPCVSEARRILEAAGYEVLVFHATGTGGRAMESLMEAGFIQGVLDITTTELADEFVGGVLSAGPDRLTVAGRLGIPQVVSIGAMDMVNFGPPETIPEKFHRRRFYRHNPSVTLMRTTPEENQELGRRVAERLNPSRGAVNVVLPRRGVSLYAKADGVFFDAAADEACREAIRKHLRRDIKIIELDTDINAPEFASACAKALLDLLRVAPPESAGKQTSNSRSSG